MNLLPPKIVIYFSALAWLTCLLLLWPLPGINHHVGYQIQDNEQILFEQWADWIVAAFLVILGFSASLMQVRKSKLATIIYSLTVAGYLIWRWLADSAYYFVLASYTHKGVVLEAFGRVYDMSPPVFFAGIYFNLLLPIYFVLSLIFIRQKGPRKLS